MNNTTNSQTETRPASSLERMVRRQMHDLNCRVRVDVLNAVASAVVPSVNCPGCNRRGHRRRGVHFDHEWRCGDCDLVWIPGDVHLMIELPSNDPS